MHIRDAPLAGLQPCALGTFDSSHVGLKQILAIGVSARRHSRQKMGCAGHTLAAFRASISFDRGTRLRAVAARPSSSPMTISVGAQATQSLFPRQRFPLM
jgi:hypothetical protein